MKLNIGCGYNKMEGFFNIDKAKEVNPDKVVDIEKGLPFEDNSVEYIYCKQVLQHVSPCKLSFVIDEIIRVSKNKAILELIVPFDNIINRSSISNHRCFTWNSFSHLEENALRNYYHKAKFKRIHKDTHLLIKAFFCLFPFLKSKVYLKFQIIK